MKEHIKVLIPDTQDNGDGGNNGANDDANSWTRVYKEYLQHGREPSNNNEARTLRMKASRFTIIDNVLFKKSSTILLQRFLEKDESNMVLRDVHEGECGNHTNRRNLSLKILRMGYYWPTVIQDTLEYTKKI